MLGVSMGVRFIGGRPRVFTLGSCPASFHAEDTFFAPRRWFPVLALEGVTADAGSTLSSQKWFRVDGVIAEAGQRVSGVCAVS